MKMEKKPLNAIKSCPETSQCIFLQSKIQPYFVNQLFWLWSLFLEHIGEMFDEITYHVEYPIIVNRHSYLVFCFDVNKFQLVN